VNKCQEKAWRDIRHAAINEQSNKPLACEFQETLRREYERAATEIAAEGIAPGRIEANSEQVISDLQEMAEAKEIEANATGRSESRKLDIGWCHRR